MVVSEAACSSLTPPPNSVERTRTETHYLVQNRCGKIQSEALVNHLSAGGGGGDRMRGTSAMKAITTRVKKDARRSTAGVPCEDEHSGQLLANPALPQYA